MYKHVCVYLFTATQCVTSILSYVLESRQTTRTALSFVAFQACSADKNKNSFPSLPSQLVLRAPLSRPKGQDYVSSVRSTAAPPSRPPPSVVVGTDTTAGTWTDRRTCAPVSQTHRVHVSVLLLSGVPKPQDDPIGGRITADQRPTPLTV